MSESGDDAFVVIERGSASAVGVVVGVVVVGAGWYLTRLARGPNGTSMIPRCSWLAFTRRLARAVVWTKDNPTPWNTVKPDENTKLLTVNQHFEKRYVRPYRPLPPCRPC